MSLNTLSDPKKAAQYFADKMAFTIGPFEVSKKLTDGHHTINIIDVRAAEDYQQGHLPHAINLPKDEWGNLEKLSKDKVNVLYCYSQVCHLAAAAGQKFAMQGYPVMEMEGGFDTWKKFNLAIEK